MNRSIIVRILLGILFIVLIVILAVNIIPNFASGEIDTASELNNELVSILAEVQDSRNRIIQVIDIEVEAENIARDALAQGITEMEVARDYVKSLPDVGQSSQFKQTALDIIQHNLGYFSGPYSEYVDRVYAANLDDNFIQSFTQATQEYQETDAALAQAFAQAQDNYASAAGVVLE